MSKIIRMTPEYIEECRKDFEKALSNAKLADGKISFTKTFSAEKNKATLYFTAEAWVKIVMLIQEFTKEVAWHGVAHRLDGDGDDYIITDILVYPQEVTGATVEMDTEKYAMWLQENDEDERFYNIHMQGHSHVNMAPSPSSVDLNHQEEILSQLGDDDFYIFMIYNKSYKRNIKIYDLQKNVLFEDGDIEVRVQDAGVSFDEFIKGAKDMVKEKTYVYTGTYQGGNQTQGTQQTGKPYNPLTSGSSSTPAPSTPVTPASGTKGEKKEKPKSQIGAGWQGANACDAQTSFYDDDCGYGYGYGYGGYYGHYNSY